MRNQKLRRYGEKDSDTDFMLYKLRSRGNGTAASDKVKVDSVRTLVVYQSVHLAILTSTAGTFRASR